jgi:hypothetical protein
MFSSFHAECLNTEPPEGKFYCDNCESGRMPLYDEIGMPVSFVLFLDKSYRQIT